MKRKFLVLAAVFISGYAQSQDTATAKQLDEVIVTANKLEQKRSQTGKVVSIISQEVLKRNAGKSLTEILNYQTGIFINGANNNSGTNQDFYFRGAATGNVLILIDGVPVNDPSQINNSYDINNINPNQIERVEILKGAQSTLWGSDAVAGVVNIITKKGGNKKVSPNLLLSYGSYGTFRGNLGINGKAGGFTYNINYTNSCSKGFSSAYDSTGNKNYDKDEFKQNNLQANFGYQLSKTLSFSYFVNYGKYKSDIDAAAFTDDDDIRIENENLINTFGASYKNNKLKLNFTQSIITSNRKFIDDSTDIGGFSTEPFAFYTKWARGNYEGLSSVTELFSNYITGSHFSLVGGVQYLNQNTAQNYSSVSNFGPFKSTPLGNDSTKAQNFSAYASALLLNIKGFSAEAGFRYNNNNIYGSNTTYSFNPSYSIDENTKMFINISSGYRIPSLYQLYSEYGNKDLKPEESRNYEIGVQAVTNQKRNTFKVVAFRRDIKNLIVFFFNPTTFASNYVNRDKQNDYGFELESNIALGKKGSWINNFTYVDGQGTVNNTKIRNLFRRPNFVFNSILTVQPFNHLTLMPSFRFIGTRTKGQFDAGPTTQPQFYTIDVSGNFDFSSKIRAFIDLRNLTNQQYFDIAGYNSRQFNFMTGIILNF